MYIHTKIQRYPRSMIAFVTTLRTSTCPQHGNGHAIASKETRDIHELNACLDMYMHACACTHL